MWHHRALVVLTHKKGAIYRCLSPWGDNVVNCFRIIEILPYKSSLPNIKHRTLRKNTANSMRKNLSDLNTRMPGNEIRIKQGKISCPSTELNLGITLKGGQSFRYFLN